MQIGKVYALLEAHIRMKWHRKYAYSENIVAYGSVSAGREKWPFNVIFFLEVEPPCDQT